MLSEAVENSGDADADQLPDDSIPHAQIVFGLVGILRLVAGKQYCSVENFSTP